MHIESISGDAENTTASRGISRRSVMKVGAAAAWSVPLVQVVAAAPAHASVSGGPAAELAVSQPTGSQSDSGDARTASLTFSVSNTGTTDSDGIFVTVAFTQGWHKNGLPTSSWSATPTMSHGKSFAALAPGGHHAITLSFSGKKDGAVRVAGTVTVLAGDLEAHASFTL
jgi:hypothetical protein